MIHKNNTTSKLETARMASMTLRADGYEDAASDLESVCDCLEVYMKAYHAMYNVAASYSNLCDACGTTRANEREMEAADKTIRNLNYSG